MDKNDLLILKMMEYDKGNPWMIQHLIKVHEFSRLIGLKEGLDEETLQILEVSAIVHDIGIKAAREKYSQSNGKLQEKEGPPIAEKMLEELGYDKKVIERVCYLVAHHHTYTDIDNIDYQILVEADFLVNLYEENSSLEAVKSTYEKIFKTASGQEICRKIFGF